MIVQYGVQCSDSMENIQMNPQNAQHVVIVLVFAKSEQAAIEKAKKYITRLVYKVVHVQEFKDPRNEIDNLRKQPWEKDEDE